MSVTARLHFLLETTELEARHLKQTDARLFCRHFDVQRAESLRSDQDEAERVDAFVARFARLQDTLGDKVLPLMLEAHLEPVGSMMENLLRAEKLRWLESATTWISARKLRNRMIHEYVRDATILAEALNAGHEQVATLLAFNRSLHDLAERLPPTP